MTSSSRFTSKFACLVYCGFLAAVTGWSFRPYPRPASHLVEPRLIALQEPYTRLETSYFADGGSIGILIVDANGREEKFALPNRMMRNENHDKVYVGALYLTHSGAVPVANSEATKQELIRVLANYRSDPQVESKLAILSGRWRDMARATANRLLGRMK